MSRYSDQVTNQYGAPIAGASVYVYDGPPSEDGALVTGLTDDEDLPLDNPLTTDAYGNFHFITDPGTYTLRYVVNGNIVFQQDGIEIGGAPLTVTVVEGSTVIVTTIELLAGIASPINGQVAKLVQTGRAGDFQYSTANHAANVTADPYQGLYVAPSADTDGSSGAWVRLVGIENVYHAAWWGWGGANNATNHLRGRTIEALRPSGSTVVFPNEAFEVAALTSWVGSGNGYLMTKPGRLTAAGPECVWTPSHDENNNPITIATSDFEVDHLTFADFVTTGTANQRFPIYVSSRYAGGPVEIEDGKIHDNKFLRCSTGIRVMYQPWSVDGVATVFTPRRIKIYRNTMLDHEYQGILPWGDDIELFANVVLFDQASTWRAQSFPIRCAGGNRVDMHHNRLQSIEGRAVCAIQTAGVDAVDGSGFGRYQDARNHTFQHNICTGSMNIEDYAEDLDVSFNTFDDVGGLTSAVRNPTMITLASAALPIRQGHCTILGNKGKGFNSIMTVEGNYGIVEICGNKATGNAYSGAANDAYLFKLNGALGYVRELTLKDNKQTGVAANYQYPIRLVGNTAGMAVIEGNLVPEGVTDPVVADGASGGKVKTNDDGTFVNWGSQTAGSNVPVPTGTHAAAIANIATSPRATL